MTKAKSPTALTWEEENLCMDFRYKGEPVGEDFMTRRVRELAEENQQLRKRIKTLERERREIEKAVCDGLRKGIDPKDPLAVLFRKRDTQGKDKA